MALQPRPQGFSLSQRTATATLCIPHDIVSIPGPRAGKSEMAFFVVILDSNYSKMSPKFVKQKSH